MTIRLINEFYQNQDEVNRTYYGSFAGITYTSYPENGIISAKMEKKLYLQREKLRASLITLILRAR